MPELFRLENISYRYPDGSTGLDQCSLSIERGSRSVVMGANGAGKTTLFLQLNGILRPTTGRVCFNGCPLDYSRNGLRQLRSKVGLLFQNPDNQLLSASVQEDVSFGPLNLGLEDAEVRARISSSLEAVGMSDYAEKPVQALSYGQKKRVCIAGLLAMDPEVLILDEPMAGLDLAMKQELEQILNALHQRGMTIILSSHDSDFVYRWSDQILLISGGRCSDTFQTEQLPDAIDRLSEQALGIPSVISAYQALIAQQLIPAASPPPRSIKELTALIKQLPLPARST
ncbi:energy-coupling factor ABC transporter ATP-binding protein [Trichlorobacter lovleyi]|uniref:energy-coupling factor ABC transporter ATP-binding protein n=1 Tax=Trichlorobacter lovleyi TaxID=313985 RepID=UPI0023F48A9C|nr:ABC transporter ATP-binding protein [Trichlorobacter lovleyi]